jgi:hypothetical protein
MPCTRTSARLIGFLLAADGSRLHQVAEKRQHLIHFIETEGLLALLQVAHEPQPHPINQSPPCRPRGVMSSWGDEEEEGWSSGDDSSGDEPGKDGGGQVARARKRKAKATGPTYERSSYRGKTQKRQWSKSVQERKCE